MPWLSRRTTPPSGGGLRLASSLGQSLLGLAIVCGLWLLLARSFAAANAQRITPGWQISRPPSEVTCLAVLGAGLWAGGKDGLTIVDRASGRQRPLPSGAPSFAHVRALLLDSHGTLWVGHDGGLAAYADGHWRDFSGAGLPVPSALSLLEDHRGVLWIGSAGQVAQHDGTGFRLLQIPKEFKLASADVLYEDSAGTLWIGCASPTYGGLVSNANGEWRRYSVRDGLPHPTVNMILEDSRGVLWVATGFANRGGVAKMSRGQWSALTKRDGLAGWKVRSVFEDRQGRLWFGSEYDGVAVLSGGGWRVIPPSAGLAGREVKAVVQDEAGVYWLGTDSGLSRIPSI
jgi:ligand-binding sensor domain-containing protein